MSDVERDLREIRLLLRLSFILPWIALLVINLIGHLAGGLSPYLSIVHLAITSLVAFAFYCLEAKASDL